MTPTADSEFLASFKVEIDDTGVERLQDALSRNRALAEELAAAFDAARSSVSGFFSELQASNSLTGELGPIQQLKNLAAEGAEFKLSLDDSEAMESLQSFIETANGLFTETEFPLKADPEQALQSAHELVDAIMALFEETVFPLKAENGQALETGERTVEEILSLFEGTEFPLQAENSRAIETGTLTVEELLEFFESTFFPLLADNKKVLQEGQNAMNELMRIYGSTYLPLLADASAVLSEGEAALSQLETLYSGTTLTVNVQEVTSTATTSSGDESISSNVPEGSNTVTKPTQESNPSTVVRPTMGISLNSIMRAASGGRFSSPTRVEIAEDGDPEYVVPVKKESIAVPLLKQLIGELSEDARRTLQKAFPAASGLAPNLRVDLHGLVSASSAAAVPTITQNNTHSVQAPVSIQVQAAGSDPETVGRSIYNITENFLLRTLKSAEQGNGF